LRNLVLILVLGFVLWAAGSPMPATVDAAGISPLLTAPFVLVVAAVAAALMFRRTSHG
jgi:lipopolysaccharide export LptBFGC system permease protein LptF